MIKDIIHAMIKRTPIAGMLYKCSGSRKSHGQSSIQANDSCLNCLLNYSPYPKGTCLGMNSIEEKYDLQVVVPVYNVRNYVEQCIDSILNQKTKYEFHVVIVDDGSTDDSGKIIEKYSGDSRVKIIHQENKGLSGARNTAIRKIEGKYLMYVDSDDRLRENAIENLLDIAFREDADIVQGGYMTFGVRKLSRKVRYGKCHKVGPYGLYGFAWGKVYRNTLFKERIFPEGFLFEDSVNSFVVHPEARNIWVIPEIVYDYRSNPNGVTLSSPRKPKSLDTYYITDLLMKERAQIGLENNPDFVSKVRRQIVCNQSRLTSLPDEIRESVFVLSAQLYIDAYENCNAEVTNQADRKLYSIMKNRDFADFELACRWIL